MGQFSGSSHSQHGSNPRRTIRPYPSFTFVVLGRSQRLRKANTCTPVVQAVAGWGMTTFDCHPEPVHGDAHNTEPMDDVRQNSALADSMLEPKADDLSEISVLDLGEPAVNSPVIQKVRHMVTKLLLFSKKHSQ